PQLAAWAADASARLAGASETWDYLCRALQSVDEPQERPTPAQMLALARRAIDLTPADRGPLQAASPRLAYIQTPPVRDHSRSPVLAMPSRLSHAASPPGAAGSAAAAGALPTVDHLRILRERIIGRQQQSAPAPPPDATVRRSPVPQAPEPAAPAPAMYGVAPAQSLSPRTQTPPAATQPAASSAQIQNFDELRQRIALMRSTLRHPK
ncbi:hypothetical protein IWQ56_007404, partial [Coemansia nantahalensis]